MIFNDQYLVITLAAFFKGYFRPQSFFKNSSRLSSIFNKDKNHKEEMQDLLT